MKIAATIIATGKYITYAKDLIDSLEKFFPSHDVILFTDNIVEPRPNLITIYQPHLGWPMGVLKKFHLHLANADLLKKYDHILHMDADMLVVNPIGPEEIFVEGITATLHPSYPNSFERNKKSTAYVSGDHTYFHTAPIAGDTTSFLAMCSEVARNIDIDMANKVEALWHDESYVNRYLIDHPPAKILTPLYCFPDPQYIRYEQLWTKGAPLEKMTVKIRHVEKPNKQEQFRKGAVKKALIGIISCNKHRHLHDAQRHTWLRDLPPDMYRFFIGRPEPQTLLHDEEFLDVGDGRDEEMTSKSKAMFRWALENGYTHVYKCDTDTLVNSKLLLNSGYEAHDYIGGKNLYFASGGAGYWLSQRAMQLVASAPQFEHGIEKDEDVTVFKILEKNGIPLHADDRYKFWPGAALEPDTISFHLSSVLGWGHHYDPDLMYTYYQQMKRVSNTSPVKLQKLPDPMTKDETVPPGAWVWRDGRKIRLDMKGNVIHG